MNILKQCMQLVFNFYHYEYLQLWYLHQIELGLILKIF